MCILHLLKRPTDRRPPWRSLSPGCEFEFQETETDGRHIGFCGVFRIQSFVTRWQIFDCKKSDGFLEGMSRCIYEDEFVNIQIILWFIYIYRLYIYIYIEYIYPHKNNINYWFVWGFLFRRIRRKRWWHCMDSTTGFWVVGLNAALWLRLVFCILM